MFIFFVGVWSGPRSEPGVGPVLPRVPPDQPAAAAADVTGVAVREPASAELPRPRTGRARVLCSRSGSDPYRTHTEQFAGSSVFRHLLDSIALDCLIACKELKNTCFLKTLKLSFSC